MAEKEKLTTTRKKHPSSIQEVPVGNPKIVWILFSLLILVVLIIRMNFLSIPFERDDGTYNYFGQLVLDGKIHYLDFMKQNLPENFIATPLSSRYLDQPLKVHTLDFCSSTSCPFSLFFAAVP